MPATTSKTGRDRVTVIAVTGDLTNTGHAVTGNLTGTGGTVTGELTNSGAAVGGNLTGTGLAVPGNLTDTGGAVWRDELAAHLRNAPGAVVVNLTGLTGWGTQAQAGLLHLLRHERANGRTVSVTGLTAEAAQQAHDSGMARLLMTKASDPGTRPGWLTGQQSPALANSRRGTMRPAAAHTDSSRRRADEEPRRAASSCWD